MLQLLGKKNCLVIESNQCVHFYIGLFQTDVTNYKWLFWLTVILPVTIALPVVSEVLTLQSPQVKVFPFLFLHFHTLTFKSTLNDYWLLTTTFFIATLSWLNILSVFFRPRQQSLPCFSSPQTWRTGYASLSVQVILWSSPLQYNEQKKIFHFFFFNVLLLHCFWK